MRLERDRGKKKKKKERGKRERMRERDEEENRGKKRKPERLERKPSVYFIVYSSAKSKHSRFPSCFYCCYKVLKAVCTIECSICTCSHTHTRAYSLTKTRDSNA